MKFNLTLRDAILLATLLSAGVLGWADLKHQGQDLEHRIARIERRLAIDP